MTATHDKHARSPQGATTALRLAKQAAAAALILLIVLVRVVYPGSDAYARLTWSSALLTDEGFYIHNARNLVLFGHARTDEFNNALIMPLLHLAQVLVFRVWGVGAMQARSISIVASLLTLVVLCDALRRIWGLRCAWLCALLLGLDPAFALYNRLALMDTPACLPLCLAFWLWTLAQTRRQEEGDKCKTGRQGDGRNETTRPQDEQAGQEQPVREASASLSPCLPVSLSPPLPLLPLFLCGLCLGLAYCVRGLTAVVAPVPLLLLAREAWHKYKQDKQEQTDGATAGASPPNIFSSKPLLSLYALLAGLALVLLAYVVLWYLPNKTEMAHVNRFYLHEQLLPRSLAQFGGNVWTAVSHRHRGVLPFLLKHSPILLLLSGCWLGGQTRRIYRVLVSNARKAYPDPTITSEDQTARVYGQAQSGDSIHTQATVTPSGLDTIAKRQSAYFLAGWLLAFCAFVSIVDYAPSRYYVMFYPALAGLAAIMLDAMLHTTQSVRRSMLRRLLAFLAVVWVCLNGYWYADWIGHLTYRQQAADTWLNVHLPAGSVLLGAVAPGLCLNNRFKCVVMIDNLCNYHAPVEKFAPAARYVVILDTDADAEPNLRLPSQRLWANRWKEKWWLRHYPSVVRHDNRLVAFPHMLRRYFTVGVYPVPADYRPAKFIKTRSKIRIRPYWRDSVSSRENVQAEALLERQLER